MGWGVPSPTAAEEQGHIAGRLLYSGSGLWPGGQRTLDFGNGHTIPLTRKPWVGWGAGQAAGRYVWYPALGGQLRSRANVQGMPECGDCLGRAPRWPGASCREGHMEGEAIASVSRAAPAERTWEEEVGPSLTSAPGTPSKVWSEPSVQSTGGSWPHCCAVLKDRACPLSHRFHCGTHRSGTPSFLQV